jgi:hypothetical protein
MYALELYSNGCFKSTIKDIMPITCIEFEQGFKYLVFYLKPNKYHFEDWLWLYKKIEAKFWYG